MKHYKISQRLKNVHIGNFNMSNIKNSFLLSSDEVLNSKFILQLFLAQNYVYSETLLIIHNLIWY